MGRSTYSIFIDMTNSRVHYSIFVHALHYLYTLSIFVGLYFNGLSSFNWLQLLLIFFFWCSIFLSLPSETLLQAGVSLNAQYVTLLGDSLLRVSLSFVPPVSILTLCKWQDVPGPSCFLLPQGLAPATLQGALVPLLETSLRSQTLGARLQRRLSTMLLTMGKATLEAV